MLTDKNIIYYIHERLCEINLRQHRRNNRDLYWHWHNRPEGLGRVFLDIHPNPFSEKINNLSTDINQEQWKHLSGKTCSWLKINNVRIKFLLQEKKIFLRHQQTGISFQ